MSVITHLYRVREDVPELDVRAGDWFQLETTKRKAYILREIGAFDAPDVHLLASKVSACAGERTPDEVLGIRRPKARKRARAPKLTLVRGGA